MKMKLSVLLGGMIALLSLQAFAINNCSSDKYFKDAIKIPLNKPTKVTIGKKGSYQCFTVEVPNNVTHLNMTLDSSGSDNLKKPANQFSLMAVKAQGYPDITRVVSSEHDDFNDCAIPVFHTNCSTESVKPGLYRGVLQRAIFGSSEDSLQVTFEISGKGNDNLQTSLDASAGSECAGFPDSKDAFKGANLLKVQGGDQQLVKGAQSNEYYCFKLPVSNPGHDLKLQFQPPLFFDNSTLYVSKINQVPQITDEKANACVLQQLGKTDCTVKAEGQSGTIYLVYQKSGSVRPDSSASISITPDGETNYSQ